MTCSEPLRRLASVGVAMLMVVSCEPAETGRQNRPDVILVTVDTLRADHLGFMGHTDARTPNLDALASSGTVFSQATTPVPRTTPGLATMLTGLWPHHHGSREVGEPLVTGRLLSEYLDAAGYWNVGVTANGAASAREGLAEGFVEFVDSRQIQARNDEELYDYLRGTEPNARGWAEAVNREALQLVRRAPRERPLLLWVLYIDPHSAYAPPSPWQDAAGGAGDCWSLYDSVAQDRRSAGEVYNDIDGITTPTLEHCTRLYDAEIEYTDDRIGRLLTEIRAARAERPRIVVLTADHGENLGEGGLFYEHGDNAHDAALRVPLVFAAEGPTRTRIPAGRIDDGAVSLADVTPTILGLLDIESAPGAFDGSDLSDRLRPDRRDDGRERDQRITFAESAAPTFHESARHQLETGFIRGIVCLHGDRHSLCQSGNGADSIYTLHDRRADPKLQVDVSGEHPEELGRLLQARERWPVGSPRELVARTRRFKLVRRPLLSGGYEERLIDLSADPTETLDVTDVFPQHAERLRRALDEWLRDWSPPTPLEPDPDLGRRLRALGYIR